MALLKDGISEMIDGKRVITKKPELLAPAGNLEKLKIAVHYGADAVFIGGKEFGLRSNADNFSRCPHLQAKICPSPSPRSSSFFLHCGQRAFVTRETFLRCPHSRSWQTSILPFFPFTSSIGFPQSGQFFVEILSCLYFLVLALISATISFVYFFISLINTSFFNFP